MAVEIKGVKKAYVDEQISQVKEDLKDLKEQIGQDSGAGWSDAAINLFGSILQDIYYKNDNAKVKGESLIALLKAGASKPDTPSQPDEPSEPVLQAIAAVYTGGEVGIGTALSDLEGISVNGVYSDGSVKPVVGYELSGTIGDGDNTITVSFAGMTTSFTVVGKDMTVLYRMAQTVSDGSMGTVDTGVMLFAEDRDFSIAVDAEYNFDTSWTKSFFYCAKNNGNDINVSIRNGLSVGFLAKTAMSKTPENSNKNTRLRAVLTHVAGTDSLTYMYTSSADGSTWAEKDTIILEGVKTFAEMIPWSKNLPLKVELGFPITINRFDVLAKVIEASEVDKYL